MSAKPPRVTFRNIDPLQDYYDDGSGDQYSVARLVDDAKDLPVFDVPVAAIALDAQIWAGSNMYGLAFHVKKCMEADLDCPILLDWNGGIADGRHRVIKALATGKRTIRARRMTWKPEPDKKGPNEHI